MFTCARCFSYKRWIMNNSALWSALIYPRRSRFQLVEKHTPSSGQSRVPVLTLTLTGCMTLDNLFNFWVLLGPLLKCALQYIPSKVVGRSKLTVSQIWLHISIPWEVYKKYECSSCTQNQLSWSLWERTQASVFFFKQPSGPQCAAKFKNPIALVRINILSASCPSADPQAVVAVTIISCVISQCLPVCPFLLSLTWGVSRLAE